MSNSSRLIKTAVMRSAPSTIRPRMSPESETKLAPVEARSAACYADSEHTTERLRGLAASIEAENAIPAVTPDWEDTSAVHHIDELRSRTTTADLVLKKPRTPAALTKK